MTEAPWRYVLTVDGREIELADGEVTLGRSRSATIRVDHDSVSRTHALLTLEKGAAVLKDLHSSNGTFVGGKRVSGEVRVAAGDRIQLGAAVLELRVEEQSGPLVRTALLGGAGAELPGRPPGDEREPAPPGPLEISADELVAAPPAAAAVPQEGGVVVAAAALAALDAVGRPAAEPPPRPPAPPTPPRPVPPPPLPPEPPSRRREATLSQMPLDLGGAVPPPLGRPQRPRPSAAFTPDPRQPAGFFPRLLAFLVDGVILTAIDLLLLSPAFLLYFFSHEFQKAEVAKDWAFLGITLVCSVLIFAADLWYLVGGWARSGRTPGKALLRLAVVPVGSAATAGPGIGVKKALLRVLGTVVCGLLLGLGFLPVLFRKDRRGLHDLIAGTRVVLRG